MGLSRSLRRTDPIYRPCPPPCVILGVVWTIVSSLSPRLSVWPHSWGLTELVEDWTRLLPMTQPRCALQCACAGVLSAWLRHLCHWNLCAGAHGFGGCGILEVTGEGVPFPLEGAWGAFKQPGMNFTSFPGSGREGGCWPVGSYTGRWGPLPYTMSDLWQLGWRLGMWSHWLMNLYGLSLGYSWQGRPSTLIINESLF